MPSSMTMVAVPGMGSNRRGPCLQPYAVSLRLACCPPARQGGGGMEAAGRQAGAGWAIVRRAHGQHATLVRQPPLHGAALAAKVHSGRADQSRRSFEHHLAGFIADACAIGHDAAGERGPLAAGDSGRSN